MMNARSSVNPQRNDWLIQEVKSRGAIILNARINERWHVLKSRFLGLDQDNGRLFIKTPLQRDFGRAEFEIGQSVGVSFRRGHKKCVFEAQVVGQEQAGDDGRCPTDALILNWPHRIQEFQRRLYSRAKVPSKLVIPVDISPDTPRPAKATDELACRGLMLDLSAAGMNIALPTEKYTRFKPGDTVTCTFALDPGQEPQEVSGQLRHCERAPSGHMRVGLQFLGLEASSQGRQTLQCIGQAASRFRRMETHRKPRRL